MIFDSTRVALASLLFCSGMALSAPAASVPPAPGSIGAEAPASASSPLSETSPMLPRPLIPSEAETPGPCAAADDRYRAYSDLATFGGAAVVLYGIGLTVRHNELQEMPLGAGLATLVLNYLISRLLHEGNLRAGVELFRGGGFSGTEARKSFGLTLSSDF